MVRPFAGKLCFTALNPSWEEGSHASYGVEARFTESPDSLHTKKLLHQRWSLLHGLDGGVCAV